MPAALEVLEFLGPPQGVMDYEGRALGISPSGAHIVGKTSIDLEQVESRPTIWSRSTGSLNYSPALLPVPPGCKSGSSSNFRVSDLGVVVGGYHCSETNFGTAIWAFGAFAELPGSHTSARDMNQTTVVGETWLPSGEARAFVYDIGSSGMTLLPALNPGEQTSAYGINGLGIIVGRAQVGEPSNEEYPSEFPGVAVKWSPSGTVERLPGLIEGGGSTARSVNSAGDIVGNANGENGGTAVLWRNGRVFDLNNLIVNPLPLRLTFATAIGDDGTILATRELSGGAGWSESVVLIPTRTSRPKLYPHKLATPEFEIQSLASAD